MKKYYSSKHGSSEQLPSFTLQGCTIENLYEISKLRNEPQWMLDFRLKGYHAWKSMKEPHWIMKDYNINYESLIPFSQPKPDPTSQDRIMNTFKRIGVSQEEGDRIKKMAVDAVFDSVSIYTSHQEELARYGVVFCSMKEACIKYPDIIRKYMGTVVPYNDNYFASMNTAFFSDGTFVYVPENTVVPIDLSSYFRIDSMIASQFERTLIICENNSFVNYLEGCSAPVSKNHQLHAAVVEIYAMNNATINYFTLQNWYSGENGIGGVYNFVTKRGMCYGEKSEINWLQIEVGSSITWKYPSCILLGNESKGSFYSISMSENSMYVDSGTKMIHLGNNTKSVVLSKSIVMSNSRSVFRSKTRFGRNAKNCVSSSKCDTMIINKGISDALPMFIDENGGNTFYHEATVTRINEETAFYFECKGFDYNTSQKILFNTFVADIVSMLPEEFYIETEALLEMKFDDNA